MTAAMLLASLAWADVVRKRPIDCPPGAVAAANHSGTRCAPATCEAGCVDDHTCRPAGLCVTTREARCGRGRPCTIVEASAACETDADCAAGACEVADRCVPLPPSPPPPPTEATPAQGLCGCTSAGGAASAVFLLGLLPLVGRRRDSCQG